MVFEVTDKVPTLLQLGLRCGRGLGKIGHCKVCTSTSRYYDASGRLSHFSTSQGSESSERISWWSMLLEASVR